MFGHADTPNLHIPRHPNPPKHTIQIVPSNNIATPIHPIYKQTPNLRTVSRKQINEKQVTDLLIYTEAAYHRIKSWGTSDGVIMLQAVHHARNTYPISYKSP